MALTEEQQLRADAHAARVAAELIAERLWLEMEAKKQQKRDHRFVMIGVIVVCSWVIWFWR